MWDQWSYFIQHSHQVATPIYKDIWPLSQQSIAWNIYYLIVADLFVDKTPLFSQFKGIFMYAG
jgi:hypothetical protein